MLMRRPVTLTIEITLPRITVHRPVRRYGPASARCHRQRIGVGAGIALVAFGLGPTAGQALPAFAVDGVTDPTGTATSRAFGGTGPTRSAPLGEASASLSGSGVGSGSFGQAGPVPVFGVPGGDALDGVIPGLGSSVGATAAGTSGVAASSTGSAGGTAVNNGPGDGRAGAGGIPARALAAYTRAATRMATIDPGCQISWSLLAGIGSVESSHGRAHGSVLDAAGVEAPAVYGVRLDGSTANTGVVRDSDGGRLDGDAVYDRAVGPMQFLPSTWRAYALDADGDHVANPQDIDDAALSAAHYLCAGRASGTSLATVAGQWQAAYRYNHATSYADLVVALANGYASGTAVVRTPPSTAPSATATGPSASPTTSVTPTSPPVPTATTNPTSPPPTVTVTVTRSSSTSSSTSSSAPSSTSPPSTSPSTTSPSTTSPSTTSSCSPSSAGSTASASGTTTSPAPGTPISC